VHLSLCGLAPDFECGEPAMCRKNRKSHLSCADSCVNATKVALGWCFRYEFEPVSLLLANGRRVVQ
jgi:hypothetical protein